MSSSNRKDLQFKFFASGVFLANFNFSFPKIPKIASLLYFWVFVVKEKLKLSPKYLLGLLARFGFVLFVKEKIKNHLKSAARCVNARIRFVLVYFVKEKIKICFLIAFTRRGRAEGGKQNLFLLDGWGIKVPYFISFIYTPPLDEKIIFYRRLPPVRQPLCHSVTSPQFLSQKLGRLKRKFYRTGGDNKRENKK